MNKESCVTKHLSIVALAALAVVSTTAPVAAQSRSTASSTILEAAVTAAPGNSRVALTEALTSSAAITAAHGLGLTRADIGTRIAALDNVEARQLTDRVLAGGANVVISTTAIIIGLLILILLTT